MAEVFTAFKTTFYRSPRAGQLAVITMDNGQDHTRPSTFDGRALDSLEAALDDLEAQPDLNGVLLTGKPFVFSVGADLNEFDGADEAFARRAARRGHELFGRLAGLTVPTLAAINGAALGGGLEIALRCDYRAMSTAAGPIAFPEVFLSILPGWGGTQLTPRLIGPEHALDVIVRNPLDNNRTLDASQAHHLGLADRLFDPVCFFEESLELLEELVTGATTIDQSPRLADDLDTVVERARSHADGTVHGATPAPYRAIDLVAFAARGGDLHEGYAREEEALAELLPARQAQAAIYSFTLTRRRIKRQPWRPDADARQVDKAAIVGAGRMGAQLGGLFLRRLEVPLVITDVDPDVLDEARAHIEGALDDRVARGRLAEPKARFLKSLADYTTDTEAVADADVVLEAVPENMALKRRIFADLEGRIDDEAVLASNTSSLSVGQMAADLRHPERVVGLHFFNPVEVLPLLEIVRTDRTSDATMATAFELSKRLRKSAIACADTPAFIVNRLLMRFNGACVGVLRHGNAITEIDRAIRQLGLPMGPFELLDFVGLGIAFHTAETLHAAFEERFPLDDNFRRLATAGAEGIYGPDGQPREQVTAAIEVDRDAEPLTGEQIRRRALDAVGQEAAIMLEEGVVADARDIDTALLLGAGWPFFMGGLCKYLDQTSRSEQLLGRRLVGGTDRAGMS